MSWNCFVDAEKFCYIDFLRGSFGIWCRFPFFGKKYQLKFASEAVSENHCLVHFPSLMR
jgi:hypothetical protein